LARSVRRLSARGRYDAEEAFANRSRHRGVNRPRRNWTTVDRPR
jgi:hypothetical protein